MLARPLLLAGGAIVLVLLLVVVGLRVRSGSGDGSSPTATAQLPTAETSVPAGSIVARPSGAAPAPGTPDAGTPRVVALTGATVGPVVFTTSVDPATQAPGKAVTDVPTTTSDIYAVLPLESVEPGAVIAATWSYNGTPITSLSSSITASSGGSNTWVAFQLQRVDTGTPQSRGGMSWPDGTYQVTVTVNGQTAQQATLTVTRDTGSTPGSLPMPATG